MNGHHRSLFHFSYIYYFVRKFFRLNSQRHNQAYFTESSRSYSLTWQGDRLQMKAWICVLPGSNVQLNKHLLSPFFPHHFYKSPFISFTVVIRTPRKAFSLTSPPSEKCSPVKDLRKNLRRFSFCQ